MRAEILGKEYSSNEVERTPDRISGARKAQYKGLDDSAFDPDYVRPPPVFYPCPNPEAVPQVYPTIGQAYPPRPRPPRQ